MSRRRNGSLPPAQTVTIYGFGREVDLTEIQNRIRTLAADETTFYVKNGTRMSESLDLDPVNRKTDRVVVGWFELDNTFMFFSSRDVGRLCPLCVDPARCLNCHGPRLLKA